MHRQEFALPEAYTARFLELDDYGYRGKREVMTRLVEELGLPHAVDTLLDTYWRHLNHARVMPHTHEVLNELRDRGIRVGIVTNGWQEAQSRCLQGCQLEGLADDVVISKVVGLSKPDPAIYRLALERLGAEVQSTWFVGDSHATTSGAHSRLGCGRPGCPPDTRLARKPRTRCWVTCVTYWLWTD
ncbi:HAD family hydrolase [Deinococcus malanensis]|uniref:HAD family hydrolase n=1 Tax=Deinococcus malanensis TaxID=1706855 RepID=UPI003641045C